MIIRHRQFQIDKLLSQFPVVVLLGARQVGKTTLARVLAADRDSVYLDLESASDRAKLSEPRLYLSAHIDRLVVLDEVQRMPELFRELRGIIDEGRWRGKKAGRFLLLGSASGSLLRQSSESLAGRAAYVELYPFGVLETTGEEALWVRGGFPDSFLAPNDEASLTWRHAFIRTLLERDIPGFGLRIPAESLRRFWTNLAHQQGQLLNATRLAQSLGVDAKTVTRYLDLMSDLFYVRRLPSWHANVKKRLIKAPKTYVRDSGLVHALLGIPGREDLFGHPVCGSSWEGFVIENILAAAPDHVQAGFYRTSAGTEVDLVLNLPGRGLWAIEVKRSLAPKPSRGLHHAQQDLAPDRTFIVYPGMECYPVRENMEAISLGELCRKLQ